MYKLEKEQQSVAGKLKILTADPFHPSLRTKKVQRLKISLVSFLNKCIDVVNNIMYNVSAIYKEEGVVNGTNQSYHPHR